MISEPSLRNGLAMYAGNSNEYYTEICRYLNLASETEPIQSGPAHGRKTKELHPTMVVIENPRPRIVTAFGRVVNLPFALAEVVQILGGINDPQALKYYNSKIIEIQGDIPPGGTESDVKLFNAAYGQRLRNSRWDTDGRTPIDQLRHVIETLRLDVNSRQASVVLSHPYFDSYQNPTKDRACNVYAHAMIREGKLDWFQVMRSNDVIWGLPYNLIQWGHVQEYVATQLGVPIGKYTLVQDSLHVYEDFYLECAEVEHCDMYEYMQPNDLFPMVSNIDAVVRFEKVVRQNGPIPLARDRKLDYWTEVVAVFNAYSIFKNRAEYDLNIVKWMPYSFELRWPLIRWFCVTRWNKDDKYKNLVDVCMSDLYAYGWPRDKAARWLTGK